VFFSEHSVVISNCC